MSITTKNAGRALGSIVAAGLGVGLLVSTPSPASAAATLTLDYTCTYPLINQQDLTVSVTVDVPNQVEAGVPTAPWDIDAINTVSATTTSGLALIGAKTIEGSAVAHTAVQAPGVDLPDVQVPVTVPVTAVPASGAFDVTATGQAPSLTFPQAGSGTIDVGNIDLVLTARNSAGDPIALPGGNPDGSFNAPCTVDPGQNQRLTTFPIVGDPGDNQAPTADDVTGSTTASKPVDLTLKGADADGDPLTYTAADASHGDVSVVGGVATYTPDAGFVGTDAFSYTVSDGTEETDATVTVEVTKAPTTTKAKPATSKIRIGKPLPVRVTVTAPALKPAGPVTISRNGRKVASGTVRGGTAKVTVPSKVTKKLRKGKATFVVKYAGSTVTLGSQAKFAVRVVK